MSNDPMEISSTLPNDKTESDSASFYSIPITIRNGTNVGFRSADVSVKDEDSGQIASVTFGRIEPRTTATQNAQLPGGVEQAAYNIFPDVGEKIFGAGFADNAPAVNITIT